MDYRQELLEAAIAYSKLGWRVFPCVPGEKRPATPNGFYDSTTDINQIQAWWAKTDFNIGVRMGPESGLMVLDIDQKSGGMESLNYIESLMPDGRMPDTLSAVTGGGGYHYFWRYDHKIPNIQGMLPGVDLLAYNHYVVASPSRTKEYYEWDGGMSPSAWGTSPPSIAEIPPPLHELIRNRGFQLKKEASRVNLNEKVSKGNRHEALKRLALSLHRGGCGPEAMTFLLGQFNQKMCEPPKEEKEIAGIVNWVIRLPDSFMEPPLPEPYISNPPVSEKPERKQGEIMTDEELRILELQEPKEVVAGILHEGAYMLVAKPKIGKTWMALQLAQAIAHGGFALNKVRCKAGGVIYCAFEDGKFRMKKRLRKLDTSNYQDMSTANIRWIFDVPMSVSQNPIQMIKILEEQVRLLPQSCALIVLDTLARVNPPRKGRGNDYQQDYDLIAQYGEFARNNHLCVLMIHHKRKMSSDDPFDEVSGTLGLQGAADGIAVISRNRGQHEAKLTVTGRDVQEAEFTMQFDKNSCVWEIVSENDVIAGSDERQELLEMMKEAFPQGANPRMVRDMKGGSLDAIRQLMYRMSRQGQLRRLESGLYVTSNGHAGRGWTSDQYKLNQEYQSHKEYCVVCQAGDPCEVADNYKSKL